MKSHTMAPLLLILAFILAGFLAAQTSSKTGSDTAAAQQTASAQQAMESMTSVHSMNNGENAQFVHQKRTFSADDAYKQNCTRCHSEVLKVNERMTRTIVRHMRVRANLSQDEAKTILEYLNK